ncbi:hypothetical protein G6F49_011410 [Rhizopus delemar]|nr:hypothetical protein G6F49_011410 [Rhizopus delemar]
MVSVKPLPNHAVERSELIAEEFDPDRFLSSRRHLGLERMKVELNTHLKQLKAELVELINKDYQDFVNLSTNLKGVDKDINELKQPLYKIEDQVKDARHHFQQVIDSLQEQLQYRTQLRDKKAVLKLLLNIHESISKVEYLLDINTEIVQDKYKMVSQLSGEQESSAGKQIERAAIEYNQMQHLVKRGKDLAFIKENEWRITRIKDTLEQKLYKTLNTALLQVRAGEITRSTKQSLVQCLRTYTLIDQTKTGERIIREQFVRWYLDKIIQPKVLQNNKSEENHLAEMYNKIIVFVTTDLQPILDITQKTLKGSNYEVLVNSLWIEVTEKIGKECKAIFAPGQTSVFHKNYSTTVSFISNLEGLCHSRKSMIYLRHHPSYIEFMKKWQLPVYFQLKFREFVVRIEEVLNDKSQSQEESISNGTKATIEIIQQCWSDHVYLYGLAHRFYKLTLQLLKRYNIWARDILQNANNSTKAKLHDNVQQLIGFIKTEAPKLILPKLPINMQEQLSITGKGKEN